MTALPNHVPRLTLTPETPDPSTHPAFSRVLTALLDEARTVSDVAESLDLGVREVLDIANSAKARAIIDDQIAFESRRAALLQAQARSAALRTLLALNTLSDCIHDRTDRALETIRKATAAVLKTPHSPLPPRGRVQGGGLDSRAIAHPASPSHATVHRRSAAIADPSSGSAVAQDAVSAHPLPIPFPIPLATALLTTIPQENSHPPANNPLPDVGTARADPTQLPGRTPHAMNTNTFSSRRFSNIPALIALAGTLALAPVALAQTELPAAVVTASAALSKDQEAEIAAFAKPFLESFAGEDPDKVKAARNALSSPLTNSRRTASLPFRQGYSKVLGPELAAVVDRKNPLTAVSAVRIAAELATQEGFDVLAKGYNSPEESIQIAAAGGAARAFEVVRATPSAVAPGRLTQAVNELGKLLETTNNADVADAAARALVMSLRISTNADVRSQACVVACKGLGVRAKKITKIEDKDRSLLSLVRIASEVRDDLTDNTRPQLSPAAQTARREVGGDCIALIARLIKGGQLPPVRREDDSAEKARKEALRPLATQLVGAGEQIVSLVAGTSDPIRTNLAELVRKPDVSTDAQFLEGARELLTKRMTQAPFNLAANRFEF